MTAQPRSPGVRAEIHRSTRQQTYVAHIAYDDNRLSGVSRSIRKNGATLAELRTLHRYIIADGIVAVLLHRLRRTLLCTVEIAPRIRYLRLQNHMDPVVLHRRAKITKYDQSSQYWCQHRCPHTCSSTSSVTSVVAMSGRLGGRKSSKVWVTVDEKVAGLSEIQFVWMRH